MKSFCLAEDEDTQSLHFFQDKIKKTWSDNRKISKPVQEVIDDSENFEQILPYLYSMDQHGDLFKQSWQIQIHAKTPSKSYHIEYHRKESCISYLTY